MLCGQYSVLRRYEHLIEQSRHTEEELADALVTVDKLVPIFSSPTGGTLKRTTTAGGTPITQENSSTVVAADGLSNEWYKGRHVQVFLSSTFNDMQCATPPTLCVLLIVYTGDRDVIVKKVMPQVATACAAMGASLLQRISRCF